MLILLSISGIDKVRETWEGVLKASFCGRICQVASTGVFGIALLGVVFGQITPNAAVFVNMFRATVLVGASIVAVGALLTLLLPRAASVSSTDEVLQEVQEVEEVPAA